ncbi:molybdate ABC transporter substrate-binding protein [Geomesophilobacter sediminis]|uniref:Molybdate ABC transporter substrate-binding protein n=1 Tax=Geomesophilobacter sediminis TaxID=2798584 RepID=A0A8J7IM23_9BACT|nr:molybdate ABC transporter substrate-binding protein [Geomesophilobacter sediminis]MBJ6723633.1 molybdate ABC transporter substrate-binding protein [Geomesophilobacter sediminis]
MGNCLKRLILGGLLLLMLAAPALAGEINVSAAASLKEALTEIANIYMKRTSDVKVVCNFGASGLLAQQVLNGAPTDIFISANLEWIEFLKAKGVLEPRSIRPFTFNALVFVAEPSKKVGSLEDLLKLQKIAIGSPKSVPAGAYAMDVLKKAGLDQKLGKRLVLAKDVRECLAYAERGEVDGAFVYRSDALQAQKVAIAFTVPRGNGPRIIYPGAMTETGSKKQEALAFYRFLQSGPAKAVLAKYGFSKN